MSNNELKNNLSPTQHALCGGAAGLVSRFVASPLDVIKIRLQVQRNHSKLWLKSQSSGKYKGVPKPLKYKGIIGTASIIMKEEGFRAFWKGNWSAEYLYVFYGASQFCFYRGIDKGINKIGINNKSLIAFISGGLAGTFATFLTYPFDLLRTRFALQIHDSKREYSSLSEAFRKIYHQEGIRGFYHGLNPTLFQVLPYMGVMFCSYELAKSKLQKTISKDSPYDKYIDTIAGSFAGLVSKTTVFPLDVIRKRLQVFSISSNQASLDNSTFKSRLIPKQNSFMVIKSMFRHEGIASFYKGLLPGLLKSVPTSAVTFGVYGVCLKCL